MPNSVRNPVLPLKSSRLVPLNATIAGLKGLPAQVIDRPVAIGRPAEIDLREVVRPVRVRITAVRAPATVQDRAKTETVQHDPRIVGRYPIRVPYLRQMT